MKDRFGHSFYMRYPRGLVVLVLVAVLLAGCAETGDGDDEDTVVVQMVAGGMYDPQEITVAVGTTVQWVNTDTWMHGAAGDDESWQAGGYMRIRGEPLEHTFTEPGEYPYHCRTFAEQDENGTWQGMVGRVLVIDPYERGNETSP